MNELPAPPPPHLPPVFTWQDWLDWAEAVSPEAKLEEVKRLFDVASVYGAIRPIYVSPEGEFCYELRPMVQIQIIETAFFKKEKT